MSVTAEMIRSQLRARIAQLGPWRQKSVALDIGVSHGFLSDVLRGRKAPTGKILRYLGYERVVTYRKAHKSEANRTLQQSENS